MADDGRRWFGVRSVVHFPRDDAYEERVTLWTAADLDGAIESAQVEAGEYAASLGAVDTGIYQAFEIDGARPGAGTEVFSLFRTSPLEPDDYLDRYFDTGSERQQAL